MSKKLMRAFVGLFLILSVAAACGDDDTSSTDSTTVTEAESSDDVDPDDDDVDSADDDGDHDHDDDDGDDDDADHDDDGDAASGTDAAVDVGAVDVTIDVSFAGGSVGVEDDRIGIARGSIVALNVASDVDEHVHVHGYDVFGDVAAGEIAVVTFVADVSGLFEVEFEDSATFVTELEVQ